MSNIPPKNYLFEFELEIMFEKHDPYREEIHRFNVIARNHEEASKIVDKHDKFGFGFGDESWTNYSVNRMYRQPTTKYTEPRIINYSFLVSNNDDESNDDKSVENESNLIQLQGWQAIVKENKEYNLKYNNKDVEISEKEERYKDPLADLLEEATKNLEAKKNECCIIV